MKPVEFPPETGHGLYREVPVWRRLDDDCALCYRGLEDLETGRYAVLGVDFHCPGSGTPEAEQEQPPPVGLAATRHFVESLLDRTARRAEDWAPTLVEAVARYDLRLAAADGGRPPGGRGRDAG